MTLCDTYSQLAPVCGLELQVCKHILQQAKHVAYPLMLCHLQKGWACSVPFGAASAKMQIQHTTAQLQAKLCTDSTSLSKVLDICALLARLAAQQVCATSELFSSKAFFIATCHRCHAVSYGNIKCMFASGTYHHVHNQQLYQPLQPSRSC